MSSLGRHGRMRAQITTDIGQIVRRVREATAIPAAIGFGISTPAQAAAMAKLSDGVIVGSAIVKIIAEHGKDAVEPVAAYVREMKAAITESA